MSTETTAIEAVPANAILRAMGWELTEVTINQVSGFARVVAERRNWSSGHGRVVTLHRSAHGANVVESRETTTLRPGMFRSHWEVDDGGLLGRRRVPGFRAALRLLADYIDDNRTEGSPRLARNAMRAIAASL